jgi:hypothetical protein
MPFLPKYSLKTPLF